MNLSLVRSKLNACKYIMQGLGKPSFSQAGEDRIVHYLFYSLGLDKPTYVDIGTNHPVHGNNTYFFYHRGATGICIEPDPVLFAKIKQVRNRDKCLNVGIGLNETTAAEFFKYPAKHSGYNTFNKEEVELRQNTGLNYEEKLLIPLKNINHILEQNMGHAPDLVSIDVEGLDLEILRSYDFDNYAPLVLIAETIRFGDTAAAAKQQDIIDFVLSQGYTVYADTHINTIFLKDKKK